MNSLINHQLPNTLPNHPVKILLLGTFNPDCGEKVKVHYGRSRNRTWPVLGEILKQNFDPTCDSIHEKMKKCGIACVDIIQTVDLPESLKQGICGSGYSDSKLFAKSTKRNFIDIDELNIFISKNKNICVFSTWGKGSSFKKNDWEFVSQIKQLHPLVSPSLAAKVPKGENKKKYILRNWTSCINSCRQKK